MRICFKMEGFLYDPDRKTVSEDIKSISEGRFEDITTPISTLRKLDPVGYRKAYQKSQRQSENYKKEYKKWYKKWKKTKSYKEYINKNNKLCVERYNALMELKRRHLDEYNQILINPIKSDINKETPTRKVS